MNPRTQLRQGRYTAARHLPVYPLQLLMGSFHAAVAAADPAHILPPHLPHPPRGRTLVVGGGKAAAAMTKAVEDHWPGDAPLSGLVVTRYRHSLPTRRIEVVEASHPLPDGRGAEAAARMLENIATLGPEDRLLVLLSGGGSSLLALPVNGVSLRELRAVTKTLLACGAPIQAINTVRKHLTLFSGGQVAGLSRAVVTALILSDVVGDDPTHIASGAAAPDPSTYADAIALLEHYGISPPTSVSAHLQRGVHGDIPDTPKPGDSVFARTRNIIIGNAKQSLAVAAAFLEKQGVHVINLGEVEGESREVAGAHAQHIRMLTGAGTPRPFALLSGGETRVIVRNLSGHGGRNTEYLLALGIASEDIENVWGLACDTDGFDGTDDNAGALWTPDSLEKAHALGLKEEDALQANNAYGFFQALDDLVFTGPTRTNVNDFRLILMA